jgi:hypothetical protein
MAATGGGCGLWVARSAAMTPSAEWWITPGGRGRQRGRAMVAVSLEGLDGTVGGGRRGSGLRGRSRLLETQGRR